MEEKRPDPELIPHEDPDIWTLKISKKLKGKKKTLKISKSSPQDHSSKISMKGADWLLEIMRTPKILFFVSTVLEISLRASS